MAFVHTDDLQRSILPRLDANGKQWIMAYSSHGDSTAHYPVAIRQAYDGDAGRFGYKAEALFDTTLASVTAVSRQQQYYIGVPRDTISSSTWGWYQIGGDCPTVLCDSGGITGTIGGYFSWTDATVANGGAAASSTLPSIDTFAICQVSASATSTHSMFLLGKPVCGIT